MVFFIVVFLSVYFVRRKVTECGNWSLDDKVCLSVDLHEGGFNSSPKKLSSVYTNMRTSIVRHPVNLLNFKIKCVPLLCLASGCHCMSVAEKGKLVISLWSHTVRR